MTEIKKAFEDIHPGVAWNQEPPKVEDNLPPAKPKKAKKKLCAKYYKKCWRTECNDEPKCEG